MKSCSKKPRVKKSNNPRSWYAEYWSTNGKTLIGGVMRGVSSRFQSEEDAERYMYQVLAINNDGKSPNCAGRRMSSPLFPEILYHCKDAAATAIGCRCSVCKQVVTMTFARDCPGIPKPIPVPPEKCPHCGAPEDKGERMGWVWTCRSSITHQSDACIIQEQRNLLAKQAVVLNQLPIQQIVEARRKIDRVENLAMAADGPVTPTAAAMSLDGLAFCLQTIVACDSVVGHLYGIDPERTCEDCGRPMWLCGHWPMKACYPIKKEVLSLSPQQMQQAKEGIAKFYVLKREVTDAEVLAEIVNLKRREASGMMFDDQDRLMAQLEVGEHPIDFTEV
jgi:hypothetical protein